MFRHVCAIVRELFFACWVTYELGSMVDKTRVSLRGGNISSAVCSIIFGIFVVTDCRTSCDFNTFLSLCGVTCLSVRRHWHCVCNACMYIQCVIVLWVIEFVEHGIELWTLSLTAQIPVLSTVTWSTSVLTTEATSCWQKHYFGQILFKKSGESSL
jgi:hypothetical protein